MKWTEENIINFVNDETKFSFCEFIEFKGIYSVIIVSCDVHGKFEIKFTSLLNNKKRNNESCKKCSGKKRNERFKLNYEFIKTTIENRGYVLLSDNYINTSSKLNIKCLKCNHEFFMTFSNFHYQQQNCPRCAQEKRNEKSRHSYEYVKNYIEATSEYNLISVNYKNAHEKLTIYCKKHNHEFQMTYHDFQQGQRCPICSNENVAKKLRHSYEYVKNYIMGFDYILLSENYKNNLELLNIRCNNGHDFKMSFGNFVSGHRCPLCDMSSGEFEVARILDLYNINYLTEYTFDDCVYKSKLRFDFYLPDYNCCIEFDGQQHFEPIKHFGGDSDFIIRQYCDNIKNMYCDNNNIRLIRIPYYNIKYIENIIINELKLN